MAHLFLLKKALKASALMTVLNETSRVEQIKIRMFGDNILVDQVNTSSDSSDTPADSNELSRTSRSISMIDSSTSDLSRPPSPGLDFEDTEGQRIEDYKGETPSEPEEKDVYSTSASTSTDREEIRYHWDTTRFNGCDCDRDGKKQNYIDNDQLKAGDGFQDLYVLHRGYLRSSGASVLRQYKLDPENDKIQQKELLVGDVSNYKVGDKVENTQTRMRGKIEGISRMEEVNINTFRVRWANGVEEIVFGDNLIRYHDSLKAGNGLYKSLQDVITYHAPYPVKKTYGSGYDYYIKVDKIVHQGPQGDEIYDVSALLQDGTTQEFYIKKEETQTEIATKFPSKLQYKDLNTYQLGAWTEVIADKPRLYEIVFNDGTPTDVPVDVRQGPAGCLPCGDSDWEFYECNGQNKQWKTVGKVRNGEVHLGIKQCVGDGETQLQLQSGGYIPMGAKEFYIKEHCCTKNPLNVY